jgi:hypothetical protein
MNPAMWKNSEKNLQCKKIEAMVPVKIVPKCLFTDINKTMLCSRDVPREGRPILIVDFWSYQAEA